MADPFLGELRAFPYGFVPRNWAACAGQLLPINQNQALFSLLGTTYGGNGQTTFALPDLRGRVAVGSGTGPGLSPYSLGQRAGTETHTLSANELPTHSHTVACAGPATSPTPAGNLPATHAGHNIYGAPDGQFFAADAIGNSGGSQPHPNMQPYLVTTYCIALVGIFPSH